MYLLGVRAEATARFLRTDRVNGVTPKVQIEIGYSQYQAFLSTHKLGKSLKL
jgi:hypothetical protein